MKWIKKGLIFKPDNRIEWMRSHASIPIVDVLNKDALKIYFSSRNVDGKSLPAYIEVDANNPINVKNISEKPILDLGDIGTFDDSGIMPSWLVNYDDRKYMYYIGWNPQVTVSYRLSIGLAISKDGGASFQKYSIAPICDRSIEEPYFNTAPCVMIDNDIWRMWYISCTGWEVINNWTEPFYHVKYAESHDGIHWKKTGVVCIDYDDFTHAIGRPCVYKEDGIYKMLFSYRNSVKYRTDKTKSYRLGYADSIDGIYWNRKDQEVGIATSEEGWDSEMIEYCMTYASSNKRYLVYNGNGFGKSGFGYAIKDG